MRLRIITINTAKEDAPYRQRLRLLGAGLQALAPDVVLAQETVTIPAAGVDTAAALGTALDYFVAKAPARPKSRRIDGEVAAGTGGLAVLSRHPIVATATLSLPTEARDGDRIALLTRIATPAGELLVINIHLSYLRDADALRARQLAAVFRHPWLAASPPWTILGGDFNTDAPDLAALLAGLPSAWAMIDGFRAGGGDQRAITMPAYWASAVDRRLDYLFAVVPVGQRAPRWTDAAIVLAEPDADGVLPSDHRGVMATVEWPTAGRPC